ncbi:MAG: hypothetical protein ACQETB_02250 [Halobacteriota archaeon]
MVSLHSKRPFWGLERRSARVAIRSSACVFGVRSHGLARSSSVVAIRSKPRLFAAPDG